MLRSPALGTPLELDEFGETALPRMPAPIGPTTARYSNAAGLGEMRESAASGCGFFACGRGTSRSNAEKDDDYDDEENRERNGVAAAGIPASSSRGEETLIEGKSSDLEKSDAYFKTPTIKRIEM